MAAVRFSRQTLSRAKPLALIRLARYLGIRVPDECVCIKCNSALVEVVVRKLDTEDGWPTRLSERKW
jgi:hypothetical protein